MHEYTWVLRVCVCKWSVGRAVAGTQARSHLEIPSCPTSSSTFSLSVFVGGTGCGAVRAAGGQTLRDAHMLKLSPQPHVPLMLGLLKTNSLDNFDSTKSISVPRRVNWAFFSMNTLTPSCSTSSSDLSLSLV